ncbi:uncharacterized protein LOC102372123 isoform X1 [Alligator sinensis]|uniref:Uncharacterized protein LOC102372123 isoform X1 n=1 Tax=Alligator sinensis TaxID=38654 RepID=A0A1U7RNF9_ALLSI|nr:uncharacterized protein LOC102372123 isoform X1 [Alligator sinensis]
MKNCVCLIVVVGIGLFFLILKELNKCQQQIEAWSWEKRRLEGERDRERRDLYDTRTNFQELQRRWDACSSQTSILRHNITALRHTIARLEARASAPEAEEPWERGEMAALRQQLQDTQRERDQHLQEVRELRRQLSRNSSGGAGLRLHSLGLLALPLAAALLC